MLIDRSALFKVKVGQVTPGEIYDVFLAKDNIIYRTYTAFKLDVLDRANAYYRGEPVYLAKVNDTYLNVTCSGAGC